MAAGRGSGWALGLEELFSSNPGVATGGATGGAAGAGTGMYTALTALINGAREVREIGAGTVDGQPVTEFMATLSPSQLGESPQPTKREKKLHLELKKTAKLEVLIAPSGLPVRTTIVTNVDKVVNTATVDILAIDFPLVVEAPPAAQTIELAALQKLSNEAEAKARKKRKAKKK